MFRILSDCLPCFTEKHKLLLIKVYYNNTIINKMYCSNCGREVGRSYLDLDIVGDMCYTICTEDTTKETMRV